MNWETTAKMIELKNIFFNLKKYFCLWGALSGNLRRESKWDSCYVWDSFHLPTASLGHSTHRFQSSLPLQAVCWGWFCGWRTWAQRDARVPTASQLDGQGQDCNLGALETSVSPYRGTRLAVTTECSALDLGMASSPFGNVNSMEAGIFACRGHWCGHRD